MFSPKGRLYQVEYASKIVEQGTLGIGVIYNKGILFAAEKYVTNKLVLPESIEKVFKIDEHIAAISSGLVGDARRLVKLARENAQENRLLYDEPIHVETLVKEISAIKQIFTQYAGMRPFGVSFIVGGIDEEGKRLFETEPSGALAEYRAVAIGRGRKKAVEVLEQKHSEKIKRDEAVKLSLECFTAAHTKEEGEIKLDLNNLDFAFIEEGQPFQRIPLAEFKAIAGSKNG